MSRLAQPAIHPVATTLSHRPGLWARLRCHVTRVNAAHARQARFSAQVQEIGRDSGIPVDTLLGETPYDPALPFFFQASFDRH